MTDFKQAKRKNLRDSKSRIEYLRFQFDRTKEEISERAGEGEYDRIANTLTDTIKKLDSEIKTLHRVRGSSDASMCESLKYKHLIILLSR